MQLPKTWAALCTEGDHGFHATFQVLPWNSPGAPQWTAAGGEPWVLCKLSRPDGLVKLLTSGLNAAATHISEAEFSLQLRSEDGDDFDVNFFGFTDSRCQRQLVRFHRAGALILELEAKRMPLSSWETAWRLRWLADRNSTNATSMHVMMAGAQGALSHLLAIELFPAEPRVKVSIVSSDHQPQTYESQNLKGHLMQANPFSRLGIEDNRDLFMWLFPVGPCGGDCEEPCRALLSLNRARAGRADATGGECFPVRVAILNWEQSAHGAASPQGLRFNYSQRTFSKPGSAAVLDWLYPETAPDDRLRIAAVFKSFYDDFANDPMTSPSGLDRPSLCRGSSQPLDMQQPAAADVQTSAVAAAPQAARKLSEAAAFRSVWSRHPLGSEKADQELIVRWKIWRTLHKARHLLGYDAYGTEAPEASDLRRRWKHACLEVHPDKNRGDDARAAVANEIFQDLSESFEFLKRHYRL
eukprot:TRINITY_DN41922_c0_g1_i1.p1 TRINITY_DN41922_c0_g1~~TRINITY_DN41922_c0_g1_i1.p1  ORF type:complete len:469 (+),score=82.99 TRINITY_DN41922_c0_g1_i1:71-1477(+)